jgi:hypothetical protein
MEAEGQYKVAIPSAFYLQYWEGDRTMKVDMDFRDKYPVLSHKAIVSWEVPHNTEVLSSTKKRQIMENIIAYLDRIRHFKFEVDGGELVTSQRFGSGAK